MTGKHDPNQLTTLTKVDDDALTEKTYLKDLNFIPLSIADMGTWPYNSMKDISPYVELYAWHY